VRRGAAGHPEEDRSVLRSLLRVAAVLLGVLAFASPSLHAAEAKVYVILWFDTEDYILPASDDAALRVADFLTKEGIPATFKVVGEKARTLEKRGRTDVIAALKKHEIGYHSNWHSVQPTPAMYLRDLGWDEGVAEFDRREGPGRADVERILGKAPTCYGQPGSSWGPQSYGAMNKWDMPVYLDAGSHVNLDDKPCHYCGVLNLYKLEHTLRADLNDKAKLADAEQRFLTARKKLIAEGGGVVSIYYHPCEFVHKEFWDGVNFKHGANPPRDQWKLPKQKTAEESQLSYEIFADYVRFIKRFPEVKFITASEAATLYKDRARNHGLTPDELKKVAAAVGDEVTFQRHGDVTLSAAEVFLLLNGFVSEKINGRNVSASYSFTVTFYGPTSAAPPLAEPVTVEWNQFVRTSLDVQDYLAKNRRVPTVVWLGSTAVPPEAYLRALGEVARDLFDDKKPPEKVTIKPTKLAVGKYVADDDPKLWGWVIFPPGFRAPAMMELARRQAWTLKPAVLATE
jgi:hypothetical protein